MLLWNDCKLLIIYLVKNVYKGNLFMRLKSHNRMMNWYVLYFIYYGSTFFSAHMRGGTQGRIQLNPGVIPHSFSTEPPGFLNVFSAQNLGLILKYHPITYVMAIISWIWRTSIEMPGERKQNVSTSNKLKIKDGK